MPSHAKSALLIILATSALLALLAIAGTASAGHTDHMGDWVISGGTTSVSGDTIDVRGDVRVLDGGVLKLYNCTLDINWTADGVKGLDVRPTGRLEAHDTLIEGMVGRVLIKFSNDTLIERCTVRNFAGSMTGQQGIMLDGGDVTIRDSSIINGSYYGLYVKTDTTLTNVTTSELDYPAVYISNFQNAADIVVWVTDCHFTGNGGGGYYKYGIEAWTMDWSSYKHVDLTVTGTTVENYQDGLYLNDGGRMDALVERCSFVGNVEGGSVSQSGGNIILRGDLFGHSAGSGRVGLTITASSGQKLTLENNVVENVARGYQFAAPYSGGRDVSWEHLYVANCSEGIASIAQYSYKLNLEVRNSTVKNCTTDFVAEDGSTITIWDTVHVKGSGRVTGTGSWIRAYTPVDIGTVKWKGGDPISKGWLVLENVTRGEVARFDVTALVPQNVMGWEVDSTGRRTYLYLWPAIYISQRGFRGDKIDIWTPGRVNVEIVDDFAPNVTIAEPLADRHFNITSFAASGTYGELGSGLAVLQRSFDGDPFTDLTSYHDGTWTLPLVGLEEGRHNLTVRGIDAVRNVGNATSVEFTIDTVRPFLEIPAPPDLVNTTTVTVTGTIEPGAALTIGGHGYPVSPDGSFTAVVPIGEGPNQLAIVAEDLAGNSNSTSFAVVRDTMAPVLKLTAPENATWTNQRSAYVDGITEPGADLRINGDQAPEIDGEFHYRVALTQGEFRIRVSSTDKAGNRVERGLVLFVDWTAPGLTISTPEGGNLLTREREYYITGDVDDATVDHVTINGQDVPLLNGRFMRECTLVEGTNLYNISVVDMALNVNATTVTLVRDLTPPNYIVDLVPVGGQLITIGSEVYSTASTVEVHVVLDEPSVIDVQGRGPLPLTREARIRFDLKEGQNEVSFTVKDQADNIAPQYSKRITVDTTPPPINLFEPAAGARTKEESVVLHGQTDPGCNVTVDGSRVTLLSGGEFRLVIALTDGRNDITIKSVDQMGNANSTVVSVVKEGKVTVRQASNSTAVGVAGFVAGLVIGVVATFAVLSQRKRRDRVIARETVIARPPTDGTAKGAREHGPAEGNGSGPPRKGGRPGWEEY